MEESWTCILYQLLYRQQPVLVPNYNDPNDTVAEQHHPTTSTQIKRLSELTAGTCLLMVAWYTVLHNSNPIRLCYKNKKLPL